MMRTRSGSSAVGTKKAQSTERHSAGPGTAESYLEATLPAAERGSSREPRDTLTWYLEQAALVPLLTIDEEIALAARIKKGDEAAREHMIRANLRLVVKIARDYERLGLPLLDLINEGNLGLMKAVERFDPAKGGKLSTYGSWWIKQSIKRAIANHSRTIRLPIHLIDKLSQLRKANHRLQALLGRPASEDELAAELGTTSRKIRFWQRSSLQTTSLDAPIGDDDSSQMGEMVPDEKIQSPYQQLADQGAHQMVRELLALLDPRELQIIRQRFALEGGRERTLDEIGRRFGVTRERIRQVQNLALGKLRQAIDRIEAVQVVAA